MDSKILDPILRMSMATRATGLSRATIYRMIASGEFPKPYRISLQSVGWPLSEINRWRIERGMPPTETAL